MDVLLLQPIYGLTSKVAGFEWGSEQEKAVRQVQDAVHAALPLGPRDAAHPVVFEVSAVHSGAVRSPWQTPVCELQYSAAIFYG